MLSGLSSLLLQTERWPADRTAKINLLNWLNLFLNKTSFSKGNTHQISIKNFFTSTTYSTANSSFHVDSLPHDYYFTAGTPVAENFYHTVLKFLLSCYYVLQLYEQHLQTLSGHRIFSTIGLPGFYTVQTIFHFASNKSIIDSNSYYQSMGKRWATHASSSFASNHFFSVDEHCHY